MADEDQQMAAMFPDEVAAVELDDKGMPVNMGEGEDPGSAAASSSGKSTGLNDLVMSRDEHKAMWDVVRHFVTSSKDPTEYLPMANLSKAELARQKRMVADMSQAQQGFIDVGYVMWWGTVGSIALEGKGRAQAMDVIIGQQRNMFSRNGRGLTRFAQRARGVDGQPSDE